jgi:hypothetical protein
VADDRSALMRPAHELGRCVADSAELASIVVLG